MFLGIWFLLFIINTYGVYVYYLTYNYIGYIYEGQLPRGQVWKNRDGVDKVKWKYFRWVAIQVYAGSPLIESLPRIHTEKYTCLTCGTVAVVLVLISLVVVFIFYGQNRRLPLQATNNGERSEMVCLRP